MLQAEHQEAASGRVRSATLLGESGSRQRGRRRANPDTLDSIAVENTMCSALRRLRRERVGDSLGLNVSDVQRTLTFVRA